MRPINRRTFLRSAGQTAALASVAQVSAAASGRVAILSDPADPLLAAPAVRWAASELKTSIENKGTGCAVVHSIGDAGDFQFAIRLGGERSALAAEAFRLAPAATAGKPGIQVSASDVRGYVYAITEMADRVRYGGDPVPALTLRNAIDEKPANPVRSIARAFVDDVEDKPWFYDRAFWRDYLTALATQRFNRFSLTLGLGYDFPREVVGDYLHFPYPYLLEVPGYDVHAVPLDDAERDRNMETLKFIVEETSLRGLDFQLGIWTHAYQWTDSPHSQHHIVGLTPETHAAYCRDALALLLKTCPSIRGLTLRVHGESGIPEGSYDFWQTVFDGIVHAGRPIEIDMHAKGIDSRMIGIGLRTGMPIKISPKYWAEHMGLGYHQAAIRELEMPRADDPNDKLFKLSNGSRRFLRYGYGDLFQEDRKYGVLFRMWPGTQRMLLWGDPAAAAAFGHASHFCGASGVELCEPLFFKGREGTGLPGGRCGYLDASLKPKFDWEKYAYTYRIWGQHLYNPQADPAQWRRYLHGTFAGAGPAVEASLAHASRVLPMLTTAHQPSASNRGYWVELPVNMPMVEGGAPVPYSDTPTPKRFGTVSALDPQMFASIEEYTADILAGRRSGKYSPVEVAQFFEDSAAAAEASLENAAAAAPSKRDPEFRRVQEDVLIQIGLARFYAAKLRAGMLFDLSRRTGNSEAHTKAVDYYRKARDTWASMAERARGVYVPDLTYGQTHVRRGHWTDRLPAIEQDLAAVEAARFDTDSGSAERLSAAMTDVTGRPVRPAFECAHNPQRSFEAGKAVPLQISFNSGAPASVRLWYRQVNQAERWKSVEMDRNGAAFVAGIPADYTSSPFHIEYFFELRKSDLDVTMYPGFNAAFANQPYFVLLRS